MVEIRQQIAGYSVYARLVVERRRHQYAAFDAGISPAIAAYAGAAKDANIRAYSTLMDTVDRNPAKIIDHFLTHLIAMIWDLPGGERQWGYLQDALARSTHIITTLKDRRILTQDALECAAIVIICALEATEGWSQVTATIEDPKYVSTEQWSSWDGGLLPWLMKWRVDGQLPAYTFHQRRVRVDGSRRIREIKAILLPSFERRLGEGLTEQIWDTVMRGDGATDLEGLIRRAQNLSLTDTILSRLLLMVQAGKLALNANPGQIFIDPQRSYFAHPRCLRLYGDQWADGADAADTLHDRLRRSGQASSIAWMTATPTGAAAGKAIKLSVFCVTHEELRRLAKMLDVAGELDRDSPWLRAALPLFDGTIEVDALMGQRALGRHERGR